MKKNYLLTLMAVVLMAILTPLDTFSQCTNTSPFGTATAPAQGGSLTVTTCAYAGEYSTINGVVAANVYSITTGIAGDYITIRSGSSGGPVVAFGPSPLNFFAPIAGTYYAHYNTNVSCGTQNSCRTINLGCYAPCVNGSAFGSATAPAPGGNVVVTTCAYAGEYSTINSVVASNVYTVSTSVATDYITVRSGTSNGPIVAFGPTPLTFTATVAGTYYTHYNSNANCGTQSSCRTVNFGCLPQPCINTSQFGSGTANSSGTVQLTTCAYAGEYSNATFTAVGAYTVGATGGTGNYITLTTSLNVVLYAGPSPLAVIIPSLGLYRVHVSLNSTCGTDASCHTVSVIGGTPVNDNCTSAITVTAPGTYSGTTINANLDPTAPTCITSAPTSEGVWYSFTGNGNQIGLDLGCSSSWDSKIWVYTGACGAFTCVTGNDDFGPICSSAAASVTWCSQPGVVYRILVAGYSSPSAFTLNVTQNVVASPTITASQSSICSGNTATLTVNGTSTNTWNPGALSGTSQTFSPLSTTVYTVTGLDNNTGCASSASATLTVNASPTISVNSGSICAGSSFTFSPNGANTYTITGGNLVVTPSSNSSYTVFGTNIVGCLSSQVVSLSVVPLPSIVITGDSVLCEGESTTLSVSGASAYAWSNSAVTSTILVTPLTTTSYTVVGVTNSCSMTAVSSVTVSPNPTVTVTGTNVICEGQSVNLAATGASNYTWSTGSNSSTITETPLANVDYTVTGATGTCTDVTIISVTVYALPSVSLTASNTIACVGDTTINLMGSPSGGIYSGTGVTGSIFTPATSGTFTSVYSFTNPNTGCANTTSISLEVSECVGISVNNKSVSGIQVYPNPNQGEFTIELANGSAKSIVVTDVTGRVVLTTSTSLDSMNLNIVELANGVYYVSISSENHTEVIKIVKQ
jgi:hypothetical protein